MFLRIQLLFITFLFFLGHAYTQSGLVASYTMDDCTFTDVQGGLNGSTFGSDQCDCGVNSNAFMFDGQIQTAVLDTGVTTVISGDWTISMYIRVDYQGTENVDILHLGEGCNLDSVLTLRYLPNSRRFRFFFNDSPRNEVMLDGLADDNSCWQYLVITKEGPLAKIYINGVLQEEDGSESDLRLNVGGLLKVSNSPCQLSAINPDVKFEGLIDEFKIYDRALSDREIVDVDIRPDKIRTRDTTIFVGESIRLMSGGSCSPDFEWSPTTYLDEPDLLNPISTPDEDITYTLSVMGDGCESIDQVTVRVADPSNVNCDQLVLPSAFTPNDDRINDEYGISSKFLISDLESFEIFNRWGGRVFFTPDIDGTWDGTYQGKDSPATSYVYQVVYRCNGERFNKAGIVNLIR